MSAHRITPFFQRTVVAAALILGWTLCPSGVDAQTTACTRTVVANVVALDQPFFLNRLGAVEPQGMIFALKRDIVPIDPAKGLTPGNVRLRPGKRPRPLVLRMNVGDCLQVNFTNLLAPTPADPEQPATRTASVHVMGMSLVRGILDDGSNVGSNPNSLVPPGSSATYVFYAEREGTYLLYSTAATTGGEGDGGSLAAGLFGAVNVEPKGSEWYRSQVTADELKMATVGYTADGHPVIDYDARYPSGHPWAGLPVLRILDPKTNEIVHSDLTAIITGPQRGPFPAGTYPTNPALPGRDRPFREFTVIFHDEIGAVQAFPVFEDPVLGFTLHSVRDAFAINYGTGGIGAEVLANRLGVGPVWDCVECNYEEFFLSSWAVGDPAMVVDVPANVDLTTGRPCDGRSPHSPVPCKPTPGPKATKALFPEDPSNVYHSYLNDRVKFRNLHAGPKEHHIFHLHAHQWLHTPDSDRSMYLDSQAIGPGSGYTYEITYNGGGNRNKTPGDAIFHCHFYPHFAMGMWGLWRVHDVFEAGSVLDDSGRPVAGTRALPDGEIAVGTPIPAVVPIPGQPMAPMPGAQVSIVGGQVVVQGTGNPGFPFYVPGRAGHRPPHPPLDTVFDGGLPRHVIVAGQAEHEETRLSFHKGLSVAQAQFLPEDGTALERAAMQFHAQRCHPTYTPEGNPSGCFVTNGLPPQPGAPFADPCVTDDGRPTGNLRVYKAVNIQMDVKFNKVGWHFPQWRFEVLWQDWQPTVSGQRPPEPFFFRANSGDCVVFYHANLVPREYKQDDFQVQTPTDVMGQHIHLVKFDVMASDGAANGFNYEDGTFSPEEVLDRIRAIRRFNSCTDPDPRDGTPACPVPRAHPFFGVLGAQTTVQRWYVDPLLDRLGFDRTVGTVFTHDHYGPSTHQEVGMYAGLVVEPAGSQWRDPETGTFFGTRDDGGPTSWRADILTADSTQSYREFVFLFGDMTLAYDENGRPVNPPARMEIGLPDLLAPPKQCPGGPPPPCPEAIAADDPGTMTVNYRNEPLALRVRDPATNAQAPGDAGDLSLAFASTVTRADPRLNTQPPWCHPAWAKDIRPGDPCTPLLRAYENDRVRVRILVGAHEEGHNFSIHGIKWLFQPWYPDSGYRNSQFMGISEHFEFVVPQMPKPAKGGAFDFLYTAGASTDDLWNGLWGIFRAYKGKRLDLAPLPNNDPDVVAQQVDAALNRGDFDGACPKTAPLRTFRVVAVTARQALPGGTLVYNGRPDKFGPLHDPTAILFVREEDLDPTTGKLKAGVPVEPLILRARAGECIDLTLVNRLPPSLPDLPGFFTLPMIVNFFNANDLQPSSRVGLHPQLVYYDVTRSDGATVGINPDQLAAPGQSVTYRWYAGDVRLNPDGSFTATPIEYGAINLIPSDRIKHPNKGAVGALIIEPPGATWVEDADRRAAATVTLPDGTSFREFVVIFQNNVNLRFADGSPVPNLAGAEDPEDTGQKAINYRTEPLWKRMGYAPDTPWEVTRTLDFTNVLRNDFVGGDPETPVFTAVVGTPVRFRVLHPGGVQRNIVFQVHGHIWEELPWVQGSTRLGSNPLSEWKGSQEGIGPTSHFNFLLKFGAGGKFGIVGDYLYRDQQSLNFDGGLWGIFRVVPASSGGGGCYCRPGQVCPLGCVPSPIM